MNRWILAGLISVTVLLVVIPVWTGSIENVKTKWALASVANLVLTDVDQAETELMKLAANMPSPNKDCDYWIIRQRIALARNDDDQLIEIVRSATSSLPRSSSLMITSVAYEYFQRNMDFGHALDVLEILYYEGDRKPNGVEELNHLAYTRALAVTDLDKGLSEINEALKQVPDSPDLLDTRAWLQFQMGRLLEALEDANLAVELKSQEYSQMENSVLQRSAEWFISKSSTSSPEKTLNREEVDLMLWSLGTIRYHRGRILQALGRTEQAAEDWNWLKSHQLPQDDRLN